MGRVRWNKYGLSFLKGIKFWFRYTKLGMKMAYFECSKCKVSYDKHYKHYKVVFILLIQQQ